MTKVTLAELETWLADPAAHRSELARVLSMRTTPARPLDPTISVRRDAIEDRADATAMEILKALEFVNEKERRARFLKYKEKASDTSLIRVVAEGDSHFQYPVILTDIVDWLNQEDGFAVHCISAGGDTLRNILTQFDVELGPAIQSEEPRFCLLSAGGNDVLGEGRLIQSLELFAPDRGPEDYLNAAHRLLEERVIADYEKLLTRLLQMPQQFTIILHGYDYAIPREGVEGGRWFGQPMRDAGIHDPALQRAIVRVIVDRFNDRLKNLAAKMGRRVRHLDLRGVVGDENWHDELHPDNSGFRRVARAFVQEMKQAMAPVGGR